MRSWVRARGLVCSQSKFSKGGLTIIDSYSYPELKAKAHNCRVMLAWSAERALDFQGTLQGRVRASALFSLADFFWVVDSWLDWQYPVEISELLYIRGHQFLKCCLPTFCWYCMFLNSHVVFLMFVGFWQNHVMNVSMACACEATNGLPCMPSKKGNLCGLGNLNYISLSICLT